jgi:Zn-dependent protease
MSALPVVFMGTAELACASLRALAGDSAVDLRAVVTQPDRPRGRALKLQPSPVGRWLMGIPVKLHWSTLLLPLITYSLLNEALPLPFWKLAVGSFTIPVLILTFVYLHECGHAFADRLYDLPVKQIFLSMLGGICWGGLPRSRREELVITIFGPMVNLVFVVLSLGGLFLWQWGVGQPLRLVWFTCEFASFQSTGMELLTFTFLVNFVMSMFNLLLPMFPMDSGRLLRATLARWYTPLKATEIVVRVGFALGVVVITGGLVLMIYGFAQGESAYVTDGVQLAMIALLMIYMGRQELERARVQPVYNSFGASYRMIAPDGEVDGDTDGDEWKRNARQAAKPKKPPGFFARWRARRAQRKSEQAAVAETARRERVDRLLEKISREGIGALSNEERTFLSSASKAFRNRVASEIKSE